MGNNYVGTWLKIPLFICLCGVVLLGMPRSSSIIFPSVGEPTAAYDCDDETLDMYHHFQGLGIESIPVVGNLEMNGEKFTDCDHVWLMVKLGDKQLAYDWGTPRFDKQHYEGYKISLDYLLYAVQQDKRNPDLLGIANGDK
jgi:hypothetical protein